MAVGTSPEPPRASGSAPEGPFKALPIDSFLKPFQRFARLHGASGILLFASAVLALLLANSPLAPAYFALWKLPLGLDLFGFQVRTDFSHLIKDGLMVVFFFLVGLELKREFQTGELRDPKKALLPAIAALGGMAVPALIYAGVHLALGHGDGLKGWGIPMATDIAFVLGLMALLGSRLPLSLKVFVTALAIIDDLGAVLVIALFYSSSVEPLYLGYAALCLLGLLALNRLGVQSPWVYALGGLLVWILFLKSGVHASVGGVLVAFTVPSRSTLDERVFAGYVRGILKEYRQANTLEEYAILNEGRLQALARLEEAQARVEPPLQRLERRLHPFIGYFVLPLFAFANAGVALGGEGPLPLLSSTAAGVALGLLLGKPLGIFLFSWVALRLGLGAMPTSTSYRQLFGASVLCGVGFTMSLFIAGLAFEGSPLFAVSKLGIFAGSILSGVLGYLLLASTGDRVERAQSLP